MTRREMNRTFLLMASAVLAGTAGSAPDAEAASAPQKAEHRMRNRDSNGVETLIKEPLAKLKSPVVDMITLTMPPGAASEPHQHTGQVFAYILEGELENQVDPSPLRRYKAGDFFYEPPMHVHRVMRNLSNTDEAKLLIVQIEQEGVPFTISA